MIGAGGPLRPIPSLFLPRQGGRDHQDGPDISQAGSYVLVDASALSTAHAGGVYGDANIRTARCLRGPVLVYTPVVRISIAQLPSV